MRCEHQLVEVRERRLCKCRSEYALLLVVLFILTERTRFVSEMVDMWMNR